MLRVEELLEPLTSTKQTTWGQLCRLEPQCRILCGGWTNSFTPVEPAVPNYSEPRRPGARDIKPDIVEVRRALWETVRPVGRLGTSTPKGACDTEEGRTPGLPQQRPDFDHC